MSESARPEPPAGWLYDPDDPSKLRWWDGAEWTDRRRRGADRDQADLWALRLGLVTMLAVVLALVVLLVWLLR